jgi:DNA polymerase-3 subunit delta'
MTSGAANSFLKTLEEPTEATVFILVSHNFNLLLPTIISRCQIIQFHLIPLEIIKNKLINDFQIAPEKAHLMSSYSQGCLGKALEMDVSDVQEKRHEILAFLNKISFKEIDLVFKKSKEWSSDSRKVETILQTTLNLIRDMAILKITGKEKFITNLDIKDKLMSLTNALNLKQLLDLFNTVEETIRYLKRNINVQLLFDMLFIKICNVLERRAYGR